MAIGGGQEQITGPNHTCQVWLWSDEYPSFLGLQIRSQEIR